MTNEKGHKHKFNVYYDGALGYESMKCRCGLDENDYEEKESKTYGEHTANIIREMKKKNNGIPERHTPTPWHDGKMGNDYQGLIISENGENIAVTYDKKNTEFIIRAVNSYEALQESIRVLIDAGDSLHMALSCVFSNKEKENALFSWVKAKKSIIKQAEGN